MYNAIEEVNNLRMVLHDTIYSDQVMIDKLISYINNTSSHKDFIANYNYLQQRRSIEIRVKKSSLKKDSLFEHSVRFYYPILEEALLGFLNDTEIKARLYIYLHSNPGLKEIYNAIIDRKVSVTLLCNITSILENIIIISL